MRQRFPKRDFKREANASDRALHGHIEVYPFRRRGCDFQSLDSARKSAVDGEALALQVYDPLSFHTQEASLFRGTD